MCRYFWQLSFIFATAFSYWTMVGAEWVKVSMWPSRVVNKFKIIFTETLSHIHAEREREDDAFYFVSNCIVKMLRMRIPQEIHIYIPSSRPNVMHSVCTMPRFTIEAKKFKLQGDEMRTVTTFHLKLPLNTNGLDICAMKKEWPQQLQQ